MTKDQLPDLPSNRIPNVRSEINPIAANYFKPLAFQSSNETFEINLLGEIGSWWDENTTAQAIAAKLSAAGGLPIVVNIHSDGGDVFEGIAIYNLLKNYTGKVTVKIVGMAASAASIIAMAGDEIHIAQSGFLMLHNCWCVAMGNRFDFEKLSAQLKPFDEAMRSVYVARTGLSEAEIEEMMNNETFISGSQAVEMGFADVLMNAALSATDTLIAAKTLREIFAKNGANPDNSTQDEEAILQAIRTARADFQAA